MLPAHGNSQDARHGPPSLQGATAAVEDARPRASAAPAVPPYLAGLEAERLLVCENYPIKNVFAVVSWGCAATQWLARILNSHPNIYCVPAANYFRSHIGGTPYLDGVEYLRVLGTQASAFAAAGDVHGVSAEAVLKLRGAFGNRFGCAVVVREPIARLRSQFALFDRFAGFRSWNVDYVARYADLGTILPVDTYENRLALHGIASLNRIETESALATIWRSEDLTTKGAKLSAFIDEITRGTVRADESWADAAIALPPVPSPPSRGSPHPQIEDWHIDAIRRIVTPQAWDLYSALGYDRSDFL